MKIAWIINGVVMVVLIAGISLTTSGWIGAAAHRLETGEAEGPKKAAVVMANAEMDYCTDSLKTVLRRVLTNCGLIGGGRKGCQPKELRNAAAIDDKDFNALFSPLAKRGGVVMFDPKKTELDAGSRAIIDRLWADQRGASYFFVVARASPDGPTDENERLSHERANSVLFYLQDKYKDPDIEKKVGMLWLGEEYAQLGTDFCEWNRSRPEVPCKSEKEFADIANPKERAKALNQQNKDINRSAVLSWIDCRL
jgi:outer membrane protein OmpA-like peptidoglycan-associated protein